MGGYPYRRRGYRSSRGYERALQHIREAEALSQELGGTDEDVKKYFFSLPPSKLTDILHEYRRRYGFKAHDYAVKTLPKWRLGRVHMSGMVASRLFKLLPPLMPIEDKYKLTKTLWEKWGPKSHKVLRIGPDSIESEVVDAVETHLLEVVEEYEIPSQLKARFRWLSGGDVTVQEQLLNHLLDLEKTNVINLVPVQLRVLLKHLKNDKGVIQQLNQSVEIGKHRLDLKFDPTARGIKIESPLIPASHTSSSSGSYGWLFWVAILILWWWLAS